MCDCVTDARNFNLTKEGECIFERCVTRIEEAKKKNISLKEIFDCKDERPTRLLKSEPALPLYNTISQLNLNCSSDSTRTKIDKLNSQRLKVKKCIMFTEKFQSSCVTSNYKFENASKFEFLRSEKDEKQQSPILCEPYEDKERENGENEADDEPDVECTLAIIKPDAVNYRKEIERRVHEEGFEVIQTRWLQLTPEQASEFYCDSYGQTNFPHLVAYMSSGPILAMVLAKNRAVHDWKTLVGPTKVSEARSYYPDSIRAQFGRKREDFVNAVHGSENFNRGEKEIHFFFPELIIEPILQGENAVKYLWDTINSVLIEGLSMNDYYSVALV